MTGIGEQLAGLHTWASGQHFWGHVAALCMGGPDKHFVGECAWHCIQGGLSAGSVYGLHMDGSIWVLVVGFVDVPVTGTMGLFCCHCMRCNDCLFICILQQAVMEGAEAFRNTQCTGWNPFSVCLQVEK